MGLVDNAAHRSGLSKRASESEDGRNPEALVEHGSSECDGPGVGGQRTTVVRWGVVRLVLFSLGIWGGGKALGTGTILSGVRAQQAPGYATASDAQANARDMRAGKRDAVTSSGLRAAREVRDVRV